MSLHKSVKKNLNNSKGDILAKLSWKGDINDTTLKDLIPILKKIVEDNIEDVRNVIVKIKNKLKEGNDINYLNINKDNDLL